MDYKAETITPLHNRFTFAENVVVDVKLEQFAPGKSAVNYYLNGLLFNNKAHPMPSPEQLEEDPQKAFEDWAARIIENPTGE